MLIALLALATGIILSWLFLLNKADKEDWLSAAYNAVIDNMILMESLQQKEERHARQLQQMEGLQVKVMSILWHSNTPKKIQAIQKKNEAIQQGNFKYVSLLDLPGYVLIRRYDLLGQGVAHKNFFVKNYELYGKKYAEYKTQGLIAKIISYGWIGMGIIMTLSALIIGFGDSKKGLMILVLGLMFLGVFLYAMYDQISSQVNKRRNAIERQFSGVVSKLALLVTSGMIMDRAWRETAYSQDGELYREMQATAEELDNMVSPEVAYSAFIKRCNTKETAKLASALIQNLSKGNAEMGRLLKTMAQEAWSERRNLAKRDSEQANAKLMIPTMMLLISILVMIMVPIAQNFGGF